MLTKPTTNGLRALHKLSSQPEWKEVSKLFDDELAAAISLLVSSRDDATLHRMQGRAQQIKDFQDIVRDARSILEKLGGSTL